MNTTERVSKSAKKREMLALQQLGERLLELPAAQRNRIAMPEALRDALTEAASIRSREARRRQLQYIGKLMRQIDITTLQQALSDCDSSQRRDTDAFHELEAWRERLIREGDPAINALLQRWPGADRTRLRNLTRAARKQRQDSGNSQAAENASRKLFRYLKALQSEQAQHR